MDLLIVTPDRKEKIRKIYDKTEQQIREDVEIIKAWKTKQHHLPHVSDDFIERILSKNKFRIERTKQKLDNYFSLQGHNRDLISGFETMLPSKHFLTTLPMPKLGQNLERIIVIKLLNTDPEVYDVSALVKMNLAVTELCFHYDDSPGVRVLVDFKDHTLRHVMKWNPVLMAKHINLVEQAYSWRIAGLDLVNVPEFGAKILGLFKMMFPQKIYERIRIHKNLESLHRTIPKECLPREYGGSCGTIPDLLEKWNRVFENHHQFFVDTYNKVSDESLRPVDAKTSQEFGIDGTFKKLVID